MEPIENKEAPKAEGPRLYFTIAGKKINLKEVLSGPLPSFSAPMEDWKRGDDYASQLLRIFHNAQVDDKMYEKTMPKFLEWAAKPEGGFDTDFIAVSYRVLDTTCAKMLIGDSYINGGPKHPRFLPKDEQAVFYSRAYGQIEAIKEHIWDDPAMAGKKKQLADAANRSMLLRYNMKPMEPTPPQS